MEADPRPRWAVAVHGLAVWLAVAGLCAFLVYRQQKGGREGGSVERVNLQAQARYLVGLQSMGLPGGPLLEQSRTAFGGDRTRLAILAGRLAGPEAAFAELPEDEVTLLRLYASEEIDDEGRAALVKRLGWFGKLALAESDGEVLASVLAESRRTVVVVVVFAVFALIGILAGLFLLVLVGVLAWHGHLTPAVTEGRSLVYGETFALYMAGYLALSYLAGRFSVPGWSLALAGLAMLCSLLALGWPLMRGVPWADLRDDVGLRSPRPLLDIARGLGTYLTALPLLAAGIILMLLIQAAQRRMGVPPHTPGHPIAGLAEGGTPWWVWAQVFVVACVLAPLVEEIFFRGVLYTHLRRMLPGRHAAVRFLFAAAVSSFLFAVIHPQGWLGVPMLGGLAMAFCLARELNGSLLPCMVAHGLNNLVSTLVLFLAIA